MTVAERAKQRFDSLRARALGNSCLEGIGAEPPSGWCISTIARPVVNRPGIIGRIQEIQKEINRISSLYVYPRSSLHVSLVGCTQRESSPPSGDIERVTEIRKIVSEVVSAHRSIDMKIGGLNLLGAQFFVEVVTEQEDWSQIRASLTAGLTSLGEKPIVYADTEPMHLNIARITSAPNYSMLRSALSDDRLAINETMTAETIELVCTDFVVSPDKLNVLSIHRFN